MTKGILRFFFDYGAGGCLWAGDNETREEMGPGPVDEKLFFSSSARDLRDQLDFEHSGYLNPLYPPDPSLWTQALCDRFNAGVDTLLELLRRELGASYDIVDEQRRYCEDPRLGEYLENNAGLAALNEVDAPTVG